jgi:hypothetical protein
MLHHAASVVANQARCRIKSGMTNKGGAQT